MKKSKRPGPSILKTPLQKRPAIFFHAQDGKPTDRLPQDIVDGLRKRGLYLMRKPEWDEDGKPAFVVAATQ